MGSLLFLLYINDIINCLEDPNDAELVLNADDTNIFVISNDRSSAVTKTNNVLNNMNNFMKSNLLHINIEKSCYIHFVPRFFRNKNKNKNNFDNNESTDDLNFIKIFGMPLKEEIETKFLGVTIDNELKWQSHIDNVYKKLKYATGILAHIRHNIPPENYKTHYFALFESHLSYCITVFGNANKQYTGKLFVIQKHCIRISFVDYKAYLSKFKTSARTRPIENQILDKNFYMKKHTKPLFFKNPEYLPLVIFTMCLEILKILQSKLPARLYEYFNVSSRNTVNLLLHGNYTYDYFHESYKNQVIKMLARRISIPSISIARFKRNLKSILLQVQNAFDYIEWFPENTLLDTAAKLLRDGQLIL